MPKFSLTGVNGDKVFHGALVSRTRDSSVTMHWSVFRFRFGYEVGLIHILKGVRMRRKFFDGFGWLLMWGFLCF